MQPPIYLDHNATTPLLPEVTAAMRAAAAQWPANPASQHALGRQARCALEDAREHFAELVGAAPRDRVVFTSGGTEANNLALRGLLLPSPSGRGAGGEGASSTAHHLHQHASPVVGSARPTALALGHLIISAVEHPSVTTLADHLATCGWQVDRLGVDRQGLVRAADLPELLRDDTCLVAVILGQNETGVLQPVAELAQVCRAAGVPLHTDAAQVVGKLPVDFRALGAATLTVAAHKFHGPLGIGALVVREDVRVAPLLYGGTQQGGLRPGTESVALAVGMCRALELWHTERDARQARMAELRDRLEAAIQAGWPEAVVIGTGAPRLPHVSQVAMVGLDRQALFMALDQAGVACSTGSACASGSSQPSPALVAMHLPEPVIGSALRFSLGVTTTRAEVDQAAARILSCCNRLRQRKQL